MIVLHHGEFLLPSSYERLVSRALEVNGALVYRVQEAPEFSLAPFEALLRKVPRADLVLLHKPTGIHVEQVSYLRRRFGAKVACWTPDYRRNESWLEWYIPAAPHFDQTFATDGADECRWWHETHGVRNQVLRQGYDPEIHQPVESPVTYDVAFLGSLYTGFRKRLAHALTQQYGTRFLERGSGSFGGEVHGRAFAKAVGSAKVVVGSNYVEVPGYWSDRVYLTLACGGMFLAPKDPHLLAEFPRLQTYTPNDLEDCLARIAEIVAMPEPERRHQISGNLADLCGGEHSYRQKAKQILAWVKETA